MSKRSETVSAEECTALGATQRELQSYPNREVRLGALAISRALPVKDRRLVGPWCFLDRFGPLTFTEGKPMDVAPHPHIGLQTVTWLHAGEIVHNDSLGYQSVLRPGGVKVMTSGNGIAHAEETPRDHSGRLNGGSTVDGMLYYPGTTRSDAAFASRNGGRGVADRWAAVSRDDLDVVEFCSAHS